MKLANLGCGGTRPQDEHWWNVDTLHSILKPGTPERAQLDKEPRYIDRNLLNGIPFADNELDGVLCAHCLEHFTLHDSVKVLRECHRALKPGGVLMVSVPDATVFRQNHPHDTMERAEQLFGEPIYLGDGETTFMGYAGFTHNHLQLFTEDSMWCCMTRAKFKDPTRMFPKQCGDEVAIDFHHQSGWAMELALKLSSILNRLPFSLVMVGVKE
jgi:SAM-dependent methyltransferase